jgi:hypothetical protein
VSLKKRKARGCTKVKLHNSVEKNHSVSKENSILRCSGKSRERGENMSPDETVEVAGHLPFDKSTPTRVLSEG